ncbi:ABC transporter C family member 10-like [Chenopodium quinoa]|uniref:ABC-type xenobiotic transporter n=1 Tax=Chenopodium quinoa TaxID=63459 RepID=A0A803M006_CHEQI|nr:ABC transporter C family member 10-like [Chenopodium quinoa]
MMMEDLWNTFCGQNTCSNINTTCVPQLEFVTHPSSCMNHAFIICFDVLLLAVLLFNMITNISSKRVELPPRFRRVSALQKSSAVYNGCLGLVYIGLGSWILEEKLRNGHSASPIHWWVLYFFQGFTWVSVGLSASLKGECFSRVSLKILSIFAFISAGSFSLIAIFAAIVDHETTVKVALDILTFLGVTLLLVCTYKGYGSYEDEDTRESDCGSTLYTPLNGEANGSCKNDAADKVSLFAKAGLLSRLTFWWLNPLMTLGKEKTLEEEDIPKLRDADRAEACYLQFMDQFSKQKMDEPSSQPSLLWTIVACHRTDILISGFFALLKILTLSAGPLLLNAFIEVAEGKEAFKNEGYVLAIALFIAKTLESLSQRQWYFRSRLIGLRVRSLLTAAIYKKQLRLSNAARIKYSGGEIMNYVTVDAYRIGEFPFWLHQTWTTSLQLCIALCILVHAVGLATLAALTMIVITVFCNAPLAKLQHKFQSKLMAEQDSRLKACSEALVNMKVLKLYAWENYFKDKIERFREVELKWLKALHLWRAYNGFLFWSSPVLVSAATFGACYFLSVPLHASNVFTFVATLRLVQDPIRATPDVISVVIQARVAFTRIAEFLEAPELQTENSKKKSNAQHAILMRSANLSWDMNPSKPTLRNMNLEVRPGEKVAICGEVGSGKSTLLAAILKEVPLMEGTVEVYGRIAYVSQTAWIQTGTIRDNILFGSAMNEPRYQETIRRCSLVKDLELLPFGDLTEIGERGVNLSGGQKQRIQLARALYQDADIYLLDDPFSAVDAHTATSLFNEYIMEALSEKTVLLVTHQVDFLPAFHCCLLMSDGEILKSGPYHQLLDSSQEFLDLVNAHKETAGAERPSEVKTSETERQSYTAKEIKKIKKTDIEKQHVPPEGDQLIKQEERETGDTGLKPYLLYLNQNKGYLYLSIAAICHMIFVTGQILQNSWMATSVDNPQVSTLKLIVVYLIIGASSTFFLLIRSLAAVALGLKASKSFFSQLMSSLFRAPMSFYDSTPLGRILSRVSSDLSIVDIDVPISLLLSMAVTMNAYANLGVLAVITWQVLFVSIPVIYMLVQLQKYYFATAKELMRINGTTKSFVANHLAESIAGAITIRAFKEEERFFSKSLDIIDTNASPFFHNFAANEWLIQRLETLCAIVLAAAALCMVLLPPGTFSSGVIGMALSYGLSLNMSMVYAIQNQCTLANYIICVERLEQYTHIPSEAPEVIEGSRPPENWPLVGKVEISNLQIRYRPDSPLVLKGISCTFEGGDKIGIVGRTGSGKTTLIGALFRLVEPVAGKMVVDGIDICSIGLHDLRSRFGIIPQDPTLFNGSVRFNLDPLCQHKDEQIWEVLEKCQLKEAVQEKDQGLDSLVVEDGANWSMGQRQLFCLGRALLRRSRVLVLDEATASIDNTTDMILQKTIRTEFADCTVITVAHRIPTVMDCTKVLSISDGKLVEYDDPMMLMKKEGSLFGQLVKEYWSHFQSADQSH